MYAPPSPSLQTTFGGARGRAEGGGAGGRSARPLSLPVSRRPLSLSSSSSLCSDNYEDGGGGKRATWNGSYSALAMAGSSPSSGVLRRREKRRSELSAVLGAGMGTSGSGSGLVRSRSLKEKRETKLRLGKGEVGGRGTASAPITPVLMGVEEEGGGLGSGWDGGGNEEEAMVDDAGEAESDGGKAGEREGVHFGAEALRLHRKRKNDGLGTFGIINPPPQPASRPLSYASAPSTPHRFSIPTTFSPGSRFTTLQTHTRHPLSLSALQNALRNALASRRYVCAHLLALRFDGEDANLNGDEDGGGEGDEEAYWEDVRSVMGLLTSTLVDAAMRLTEALEDAEDMRQREGEVVDTGSREGSVSPSPVSRKWMDKDKSRLVSSMAQMVPLSFAPMPSHLSRFAAHVDAISSAMNEARDNLEQCVASLRGEPEDALGQKQGLGHDDPALVAYERLRRELGLALRECERGRERLLDLIAASNPSPEPEDTADPDDLPGLGHDVGSDESDKHDSNSPLLDFDREDLIGAGAGITVVSGDNVEGLPDDATSHLLRMASSHHLPPQGIEQVFEAEPEPAVTFTRERSKLTREERIALAKARRDSGLGLSADEGKPAMKPALETWGPGGDVVQELKDVIWQVGERRRKMMMTDS